MRVAIFGTSNSVMKDGWVAGFYRALPFAEVTNLSVGASPGTQFSAHVETDFSQYDFVIFDSVPNDEDYSEKPEYNTVVADQVLYELFSVISAETTLIVIGFTRQQHLSARSSTHWLRQRMSRASGAQFIDARALLMEFGALILGSSVPLYEDHASHPRRAWANVLGHALGNELLIEYARGCRPRGEPSRFRKNFHVWVAAREASDHSMRSWQNSFTRGDFAILENGEGISFNYEGSCLGFYINHASTSCSLELTDLDGEVFHLFAYHHISPAHLRILFLPTQRCTSISALRVTNRIGDGGIAGTNSPRAPRDGDPTRLAISHAVFWSGSVPGTPRDPMHMEEDHPDDELALTTRIRHRLTGQSGQGFEVYSSSPVNDLLLQRLYERSFPDVVFRLEAIHGTLAALHLPSGTCVNVSMIKLDQVPSQYASVYLRYVSEGQVAMYAQRREFSFPLTLDSNHNLTCMLNMDGVLQEPTAFKIVMTSGSGRVFLIHGGKYLAAEPGGYITCNREAGQSWETFKIIRSCRRPISESPLL